MANYFATLIVGIFLILACQKSELASSSDFDEIFVTVNGQKMKVLLGEATKNTFVILENESRQSGLLLPIGTKIEKIIDDPNSFQYTLPEGYITIGKNVRTGQATYTTAGKITCSCSSGSGCSPYLAVLSGTTYSGCTMSKMCSSCTQRNSRTGADNAEMIDSEVVNLNGEISFITESTDFSKIQAANSMFVAIEPIQKKLAEFIAAFHGTNKEALYKATSIETMPKNYAMATLNLFGKALLVPIDKDLNSLLGNPLTNGGFFERARVAAVTCKCENAGSKGCTKGSTTIPFVGTVNYCDAGGCKTCTLNQ